MTTSCVRSLSDIVPPSDVDVVAAVEDDATAIAVPPLSLILVDHNRLRSSYGHLSGDVVEILDHHADEMHHLDTVKVDSDARNVAYENGTALVASTCTLVVERMLRDMSMTTTTTTTRTLTTPMTSLSPPSSQSIDPRLALLLLGVILLDTVNMNPVAGKGTSRDEYAMRMLLQHADWKSLDDAGSIRGTASSTLLLDASTIEGIYPNGRGNAPNPSALYDALSRAKFDPTYWSRMAVSDCLRIDYKRFEAVPTSTSLASSIGISSVLVGMEAMLSRGDFLRELTSFVGMSSTDLYCMMTLTFRGGDDDGIPVRGLLLAGADACVVNSFADYLVNSTDAAFLDIVECGIGEDGREHSTHGTSAAGSGSDGEDAKDASIAIRVFRQGNGRGSRKQVAPVLLGHAARGSRL